VGRTRKGRPVNGVLILDKPTGMSSNRALQIAKRLFFVAKAGHTGSLDPLATGVLPLCFGEATKFSQFLLDADKRYRSTFRFGVITNTGDADGEVMQEQPTDSLTHEQVEKSLQLFAGEIEQVPSMFSALKHNGQPLYKLAREGIEVERKARKITVFEIKLLAFRPGAAAEADVEIHCSKGTYVRSIAEDLGLELGCGAHVQALHRSAAGAFHEGQSVSLETLEAELGENEPSVLDHYLLPMDAPVEDLVALSLPESTAYYFSLGNPVMDSQVFQVGEEGDMVRVFLENGEFLGIGELTDDGRVAPKRLVAKLT